MIGRSDKNDGRDRPALQILLMGKVLVRRYDSEAFCLGSREQCPVLECSPTTFVGGMCLMAREMCSNLPGNAMVQQYLHRAAASGRSSSLPSRRAPIAWLLETRGRYPGSR